jgi:hypothetical protein
MRLHPREELVRKAEADFWEWYGNWRRDHSDLTYIEEAKIFSSHLSTVIKYGLRVERHGDDQKPSGRE